MMHRARATDRPFRDILTELTFEANAQEMLPLEAYVRLRQKMGKLGLHAEDYCSSSITSGGHARDPDLQIQQVITRNTDAAMAFADELYTVGQLNPRSAVEAVVLGKISWKQSDYMTFWLATMAGMPATGKGVARHLDRFGNAFNKAVDQNENLDMTVYDCKLSAVERAPHYFEHAKQFAAVAQRFDPMPVNRLIRLIDADMSLGAQSENVFARLMGTSVFKLALAETGLTPTLANLPPKLLRETETLVQFGATVIETASREQLVLVRQTDETSS